MKKIFLVVISLLSIVIVCSLNVFAASPTTSSKPIENLDKLANQSLELTKSAHYTDAEMVLNLFGQKFQKAIQSKDLRDLTDVQIETLRTEQKEAIAAVSSEGTNSAQAVAALLRFRLAVDALASDNTPLWTQMKLPMLDSVKQVEAAIKAHDQEKYETSVNQLLSQYQTIYPAMKVDVAVSEWKSIDKEVQYLDKYRTQVFLETGGKQTVIDLRNNLNKMFQQVELGQSEPSLIWVIVTTAGIILITLSYVGWRKYRAERTNLPKVS